MTLKGKEVVLEYDSDYYHSTEQQKERDKDKDFMLTTYGGYIVVRIHEDAIKYEKPKFRSRILDAMLVEDKGKIKHRRRRYRYSRLGLNNPSF